MSTHNRKNREEKIKDILEEKYRLKYIIPRNPNETPRRLLEVDLSKENEEDKVNIYELFNARKSELLAMSDGEIDTLWKAAQEKKHEKKQERNELEIQRIEQRLLFNNKNPRVNYDYWPKMSFWNQYEVAALLLDTSPEIVHWDSVESYKDQYPLARKYAALFEVASRALSTGELKHTKGVTNCIQIKPSDCIEWAQSKGIDIPEELAEKMNYQTQYMKCEQLKEENLFLIEELDKIKIENTYEKPINTREKESMLKIIIGMAIGGYKYQPGLKRQKDPVIQDMLTDLENNGVGCCRHTIQKFIDEGCALLPSSNLI
jgi:hypothetical protein